MNLTEIKYFCKKYGVKPSKAKGQNFLINQNILAKIVQAADLQKTDYVLEIGPGFGVLTEELVKQTKKVVSVELDKNLIYFLKQKFKGVKNLEFVEADILKIKNEEIVKKLKSEKYKVVANLPYNITKPVLRKFLSFDPKPKQLTILIQKEVAQKIVAKPGKMNLLSLTVLFYAHPALIDYVAKANFYPQPKVDSAILNIKLRTEKIPAEIQAVLNQETINKFEEKKFWQLIKIGFSSPRKQLHNNLSAGLKLANSDLRKILKLNGLREDIRAQDLSLQDWAKLYQKLMV